MIYRNYCTDNSYERTTMETEEWIALLLILVFSTMPALLNWVKIVLLYPQSDATVYILNDYRGDSDISYHISKSEGSHDDIYKGYQRLHLDDPRVNELYTIRNRNIVSVTGQQTWMKTRLMDCLIFSRRWYRTLSDFTKILIPLWLWPTLWTALFISRVVSGFYIFYDRDRYPEVFFGFLVIQFYLSTVFEMIWFEMIFKMRLTNMTTVVSWCHVIFVLAIYITRGTYHARIGFGFFTFELVYYLYISLFMLLVCKRSRGTDFMQKDMIDIRRNAPVTVFHEGSSTTSVLDTKKARRQLEDSIRRYGSGDYMHPSQTPSGLGSHYHHGNFPRVVLKPTRASGWYTRPKKIQ